MPVWRRNQLVAVALVLIVTFLLWHGWPGPQESWSSARIVSFSSDDPIPEPDPRFFWRRIERNYPVDVARPLPTNPATTLPAVQATSFGWEGSADKAKRLDRQQIIKDSFGKAWNSYRRHAWLRDELTPVSGKKKDTFGAWGATLIDSLDTLWIMGMWEEFALAVDAVHRHISFEATPAREINVFETTIRFLGGLISAYDLSGDTRLIVKARDAGDMLYKAFDTPNHLPMSRWDIHFAARGHQQQASDITRIAELGTLSLEFTRLSIITGDPKYFDAVQHISELFAAAQNTTKIPGLWSAFADAARPKLDINGEYSLGAMSDSMYEYLPKMMALLGQPDIYAGMYTQSIDAIEKNLLYRPMTPDEHDILFPGVAHVKKDEESDAQEYSLDTSASHLACFAGGMLALGGRLVSNKTHTELAEKLTGGCVWAYSNTTSGVMPETFYLQACPSLEPCSWDKAKWHEGIIQQTSSTDVESIIEEEMLQPGFTKISDPRYLLRPEAIESVFVMYRVTGDEAWREHAWDMWRSIDNLTSTELANSAVHNVNLREGDQPSLMDSMESFWMAETLKYFYLIFSDPDDLSLDEWVFNTEAHPFRRLRSD